jgi:hypothetical protein
VRLGIQLHAGLLGALGQFVDVLSGLDEDARPNALLG